MTKNTQDSIQSFVNDADSFIVSIIEEIDGVKRALERVYESGSAEVPREILFKDIERLITVSGHMKAAENLKSKLDVFQSEYQPLAKEMRSRYADFLPAEMIEWLDEREADFEASWGIVCAQSLMIHAMHDTEDPAERAKLLYTGLVRISNTIEKYIKYFSPQLRENVKRVASSLLKEPDYDPENHKGQREIESYMIALKNTARAVLWQVDQYQDESKHKVEGILNWLEISPGWSGDDFDECLDYVNRVRKE